MRVAVIGGGPAAFGALARLVALKRGGMDLEVEVITTGDPDQETRVASSYVPALDNAAINAILKKGRAEGQGGILPPRVFDGYILRNHGGDGIETDIKISDSFGGIGNYWSSSVLPFHRFSDPVAQRLGDLREDYRFIAARIPVSGSTDDPLGTFFDEGSINCPPIDVAEGLARLKGKKREVDDNLDFVVGINRFAINTHADERNGCTQCGACMYGCPRDAIFRAAGAIDRLAGEGACHITFTKVRRLQSEGGKVRLDTSQGERVYDRVFISAGALGTAALIGASYGAADRPLYLYDNLLWYFPAFSLWPRKTRISNKSIAFAELAGGIFNHENGVYNHLLISTLPDAVAEGLFFRGWLSRGLTAFLSRHMIICALYGSHEEYTRYQLESAADGCAVVSRTRSINVLDRRKFRVFRNHLAAHGWWTSAKMTMENGTSGHYTANLGEAYGLENLVQTGVFDYNVYVCDSASWNGASMSQQHTFTIMANASKIVRMAFS